MVAASVVGRQTSVMNNNQSRPSRFSEYTGVSGRGSIDDRPSNTMPALGQTLGNRNGWSDSIWGNSSLSAAGFGSTTRDSSRNRDTSNHLNSDVIEGKTGSGSLVPSSETDAWQTRHRSPWGTDTPSVHLRQTGISPARRPSSHQISQPQNPFEPSQSSSPFFPSSRNGSTLPMGNRPATNSYQNENGVNGFGPYGRSVEDNRRTSDSSIGAWAETAAMHSPTDDRRSISNSDYFGPSSAAASRNGSLPPSRHGAEPVQFPQPDSFARFAQNQTQYPVRGHTASISSQADGRFAERQNSVQSDTIATFARLSLHNNTEPTFPGHKPSASMNSVGSHIHLNGPDVRYARQSLGDMAQPEENGIHSSGAFTPEGFANNSLLEQLNGYRGPRFPDRGAFTPSSSDLRSSPYYSASGTPPVGFDHLYPSRAEPTRMNSNGHPVMLEQKLRAVQQEQQPLVPTQFQQQMYPAQFRTPLNNPYSYMSNLSMSGFPVSAHLPPMPGMIPLVEPPRGPRDHDSTAGSGLHMRSALMEKFKTDSKGSRRYELKDIYQHIVEFSGDQHGSRFIQQKLETANSEEKERVFQELQPDALQLMQDVFGNYVIQKFFEHGDQNQKSILANRMKGHVLTLSNQMYGCRVVQKALEHILTDQQAALVKELEHHVLKCVRDQNGNHVIQKAIERVPAEHIQFIINAFTGQVGSLAMHPYGCRVIQRMLEYCQDDARQAILQELHTCGASLIPDQYGNYVTQHIIERGGERDRAAIMDIVVKDLLSFSKHKFASNVVEKCLVHGTDEQRRAIMMKIIESNDSRESTLIMLIKDSYGNYVIQKLLETLAIVDFNTFVEHLRPELDRAKRSVAGKQVQAVEKKMQRLDRFDSPPNPLHSNQISPTAIVSEVPIPPTPPLTHDARSPQSSSAPSTNASTADDHIAPNINDGKAAPIIPEVEIKTAT